MNSSIPSPTESPAALLLSLDAFLPEQRLSLEFGNNGEKKKSFCQPDRDLYLKPRSGVEAVRQDREGG